MAGPEGNEPLPMQEFYPPPSPISPSQPGNLPNEAVINRLDRVSPQIVSFDSTLMPDSGLGTKFRR